MARRFFSVEGQLAPEQIAVERATEKTPGVDPMRKLPANAPRPITGSAERIKLTRGEDRVDKRPTSAWQTAAWQYFDSIGEVHFAFSLIGQVMSRVRLYAAVIEEPDQPPVAVADYLKKLESEVETDAPVTAAVFKEANKLMEELILRAQGGISGLLRSMAVNLCVPGEMYLIAYNEKWIIASTDELTQSGDVMTYRRLRKTATTGAKSEVQLPQDTFIARIWRSHPRYSSEPDSSMLGTLDDCEELVLLQQALRSMTRSRMFAGVMFIPDGISSSTNDADDDSVEGAIARASMQSVENEEAKETVVPLILRGAADLGEKMKWIPLGRQVDAEFVELLDRTLQRVLQGLDIPKDIVTGLADVKYSNAIVVDENLYRAHVEPLVLMVVDALTTMYLRPMLKKRKGEAANDLINKIVVWADTSAIVTRPDKSQAANEGFDRRIISASSWRDSRGFSDADAPDSQEILKRMAMEKVQISPEIGDALIKLIDPKFFNKERDAVSDLPADVESLLQGDNPNLNNQGVVQVPDDLSALDEAMAGGQMAPGGQLPPRPTEPRPV